MPDLKTTLSSSSHDEAFAYQAFTTKPDEMLARRGDVHHCVRCSSARHPGLSVKNRWPCPGDQAGAGNIPPLKLLEMN